MYLTITTEGSVQYFRQLCLSDVDKTAGSGDTASNPLLGKQELLLEVLQLSLQEQTTSGSFSLDLELRMLQQTLGLLVASPDGLTEHNKHSEKEKAKASRK
jgi:hypothetical protein